MSWSTIPSRGPDSLPDDTKTWWDRECRGLGHRGAAVSAVFPILGDLARITQQCGEDLTDFVASFEEIAPADSGPPPLMPKKMQDTILKGYLRQLVVDTFWPRGESPSHPVR